MYICTVRFSHSLCKKIVHWAQVHSSHLATFLNITRVIIFCTCIHQFSSFLLLWIALDQNSRYRNVRYQSPITPDRGRAFRSSRTTHEEQSEDGSPNWRWSFHFCVRASVDIHSGVSSSSSKVRSPYWNHNLFGTSSVHFWHCKPVMTVPGVWHTPSKSLRDYLRSRSNPEFERIKNTRTNVWNVWCCDVADIHNVSCRSI